MAGYNCINDSKDCDGGEELKAVEPPFLVCELEKSETALKLSNPMLNFPKRSTWSSWGSSTGNGDSSKTSCDLAVPYDGRPHSIAVQWKLAGKGDNIFPDKTEPCEESDLKHPIGAEKSPLSGLSEEDSGISSQSSPELEAAPADSSMSRTHQYRKVLKPMLERKRRARINSCLEELKDLMVAALQTEGESITKLEKADVLELTVRHLRKLKAYGALGLTPTVTYIDRFCAGYSLCASEVSKFLTSNPAIGVDVAIVARLLHRLSVTLRTLEVQGAGGQGDRGQASSRTCSLVGIQLPASTPSRRSQKGSAALLEPVEEKAWRPW